LTRHLQNSPTKETCKRDQQKRPAKETSKRDKQKRPAKETCIRELSALGIPDNDINQMVDATGSEIGAFYLIYTCQLWRGFVGHVPQMHGCHREV